MRGRSDHSKAKPQMGYISALAGRRAAYERVTQISIKATNSNTEV